MLHLSARIGYASIALATLRIKKIPFSQWKGYFFVFFIMQLADAHYTRQTASLPSLVHNQIQLVEYQPRGLGNVVRIAIEDVSVHQPAGVALPHDYSLLGIYELYH